VAGKVTAGLAESNGSLTPGGCGLTACTPGSAPGPTLGIEYGKPLPFLPLLPLPLVYGHHTGQLVLVAGICWSKVLQSHALADGN